MDDIDLFISILISGFSVLMVIVSSAAYVRLKSTKLLLIGIAFFVFFLKSLLLVTGFIVQSRNALIIDLIIIFVLYCATVKK